MVVLLKCASTEKDVAWLRVSTFVSYMVLVCIVCLHPTMFVRPHNHYHKLYNYTIYWRHKHAKQTLLILHELKIFLQVVERIDRKRALTTTEKGAHSRSCQVVEPTNGKNLFNIIFVSSDQSSRSTFVIFGGCYVYIIIRRRLNETTVHHALGAFSFEG